VRRSVNKLVEKEGFYGLEEKLQLQGEFDKDLPAALDEQRRYTLDRIKRLVREDGGKE